MMNQRAPVWVMLGGMLLTTSAGSINAVGFLGLHHQAITHLSGTVSLLSTDLARADSESALRAFFVVLCFFVGCVISGFIIRQNTLKLGRRYGGVLVLESFMLFSAVHFFNRGLFAGDCLASMACGLQNAMATSYSGAVIRTTHMTGIITDLGIAAGHLMHGQSVDYRRLRLYAALLLGFFIGGLLGAVGFAHFGYDTLFFPAVLSGLAGLGYMASRTYERYKRKRQAGGAPLLRLIF
jgi:uncharacterized membrane protein YoaK (UPF0700 family)